MRGAVPRPRSAHPIVRGQPEAGSRTQAPGSACQRAIRRTASAASVAATRRRRVSTVSPQPGGTSRGARSASGASTNSRSPASRCGTSRRRAAFAGSASASIERALGGRSTAIRCRPKTSRSRSSSRGPQRPRRRRPARRSSFLSSAEQRERAGRRIRAGRHVHRHDRVLEVGLVGDAPRCGDVEGRHAAHPHARQAGERIDRPGQRRRGVAHVRAQADVGADATGRVRSLIGRTLLSGGGCTAR